MSPFVKDNVLPFLINEPNKKTSVQISHEIEELLNKYTDITFWAQFPKVEWLLQFGFNKEEAKQIYTEYADWDFQLFKGLWKELPEKCRVKCHDITPLISKLSNNSLPQNTQLHHALADAKWNYEVWRIINK